MPKKFLLRSFKPGTKEHNRPQNTLVNLSTLGYNMSKNVAKNSIAMGASETSAYSNYGSLYPYDEQIMSQEFNQYRDITKNTTQSYAYYDMSYPQRVEYLRLFSQQQTIAFVLDTVADETIVYDENNYFAHLDVNRLRSSINSANDEGEKLIETCERSFRRVYSMFGWDRSNGAWNVLKKFLIEGYLSFEIIFDNLENPKLITGFKYIDPSTLEPGIILDSSGNEMKVWYQNRGSAEERIIPDTNLIYISWPSGMTGESSRISYLEGLTRSYNMLAQLENSRMIWNVQNAQKRVKIVVPVGDLSPYKADTLMNELKAQWNEETHIDDISGEMVVNGNPNFSFTKTYFFPQRNSGSMTLEEIATEGYDLSSIEPLKYFWRRFILESKVPANRFMIDPSAEASHPLGGSDDSITREEAAFGNFINRIRGIFREILLKPIWIQVCLFMPKLSKSEYLKQAIGIVFNGENMFAEAKERMTLKQGIDMINTMYSLQDSSGKPMFSMKFLIEKFLGMNADDLELNNKYKEEEFLELLDRAKTIKKHQELIAKGGSDIAAPGLAPQEGGGGDGGFGDFGSGNESGDFGGFGGGDDFGGGGGETFEPIGGGNDFGGGESEGDFG